MFKLPQGGPNGRSVDGAGCLPESTRLKAAAEEGAAVATAAATTTAGSATTSAANIFLSAGLVQRNLGQLNSV